MPITYGSVCSGIEAATRAWKPLGMRATLFSEIEAFPSGALAHHYPNTPNRGDMTKFGAQLPAGKIVAPDILVGGTICQAFSIAGILLGLTDPRGALTIKYMELADATDCARAAEVSPPPLLFGKASPVSLVTKGTPSDAFLERLLGKTANCSLQGRNGQMLVVCMDPKEQLRGGS